jgi:hypothetical protein
METLSLLSFVSFVNLEGFDIVFKVGLPIKFFREVDLFGKFQPTVK